MSSGIRFNLNQGMKQKKERFLNSRLQISYEILKNSYNLFQKGAKAANL